MCSKWACSKFGQTGRPTLSPPICKYVRSWDWDILMLTDLTAASRDNLIEHCCHYKRDKPYCKLKLRRGYLLFIVLDAFSWRFINSFCVLGIHSAVCSSNADSLDKNWVDFKFVVVPPLVPGTVARIHRLYSILNIIVIWFNPSWRKWLAEVWDWWASLSSTFKTCLNLNSHNSLDNEQISTV